MGRESQREKRDKGKDIHTHAHTHICLFKRENRPFVLAEIRPPGPLPNYYNSSIWSSITNAVEGYEDGRYVAV